MSNISYYTAEGLKHLKEELEHLKSVMRPKASADIAEARDKGDLSENAEYDAAKEAQGMLEMRIAKLEEVYSNARLIDESNLDLSKVLVLSNVKIKNQANGMELKYTLVAESEAEIRRQKTTKIKIRTKTKRTIRKTAKKTRKTIRTKIKKTTKEIKTRIKKTKNQRMDQNQNHRLAEFRNKEPKIFWMP